MRKILSLALLIWAFSTPIQSSAANLLVQPEKPQVLGFGDGNMYDPATGEWKCMFLMDGNCYDKAQNIITTRPTSYSAPITKIPEPIPQAVYVPVYVSLPSQPISSEPIINQPISTPMPEFSPFTGAPSVLGTYDNWNAERTVNNKYAVIAVDLSREESSLVQGKDKDNYRLWCSSPLYPNGAFTDQARMNKSANGQLVGNTAVASAPAHGPGNYSCKFVFKLPEGTFESEAVELTIE